MAEYPNLKGVATKEHVETIGSGSYAASYIPWSRVSQLLRDHAPGWLPEMVPDSENRLLHRAPEGGFLMIRFVHADGSTTPAFPQAVQDNRHRSIPYDKISSRDLTDTQRRGFAMAAAFAFGIGYELWSGDKMESGYASAYEEEQAKKPPIQLQQSIPTKEDFLEACLAKGLSTMASEALLKKVGDKYKIGIDSLDTKDDAWVKAQNDQHATQQPVEEAAADQKTKAKKSPAKTAPAPVETTENW